MNIIKILLDEGMSVNLTDTDEFKTQRVFAELGHLEATKSSIEIGVARNYTDRDGNTSRIVAAFKRKLEILPYLTEIGADFDIRGANNTVST